MLLFQRKKECQPNVTEEEGAWGEKEDPWGEKEKRRIRGEKRRIRGQTIVSPTFSTGWVLVLPQPIFCSNLRQFPSSLRSSQDSYFYLNSSLSHRYSFYVDKLLLDILSEVSEHK